LPWKLRQSEMPAPVTAVVFTVRQPVMLPDHGIDATLERHHGYDKLTGGVVLQEGRTTGTINGSPFSMEMLQELEPGGANVPASMTGPGDGREKLDLQVSLDEGGTEERAVVTSYQCMTMHVDSTGWQPSKSSSLLVSRGCPSVFVWRRSHKLWILGSILEPEFQAIFSGGPRSCPPTSSLWTASNRGQALRAGDRVTWTE
jgi:hypothetical protein